ncbi:hypothetical protein EJD97_013038 [Solanum chilense]|uniref:F-box domain-containing protein n=2 Tax=Solanum chilense TaxID=4083 RepID=A0A6N2CBD0_SOLCI|nr:hypothetical protein EJD97_013038 [Solanum chilense]
MAKEDRLSDLPDSILIHILSMLRGESIRIVRTSLLSKRWQFLWMSVPVSLNFNLRDNLYDSVMQDLVNSTHRNLHFFRFFKKIRKFKLNMYYDRPEEFVRDIDLWVFFATKLANVEDFELQCESDYEFPQFAYKNTSLRNFDLRFCTVNPLANVNWSGIVSLSFTGMDLTDGVMQKILSGCPNLECLKFYGCCGLHPLEISNVKLRKLIIDNSEITECDPWLDILAPYIQKLKISGWCEGIRLRNVDSLVTAVLDFNFNFEEEDPLQRMRKKSTCLKELFRSIAHVEKVELGPLCIQSILELEGWQPPPSTWKFLQLSTTLRQLDFPGICSFLQSSSHLETLVIDGYKESRAQLLCYPNKDEQMKRFETHNFSGSFLHLKTIKILDISESMLPFVKYMLKHASVLEKIFIDESLDVTMTRLWIALVCIQGVISSPTGLPDKKIVVITNNHTNYLSIRCFSFDDDGEVKHLNTMGTFNITVKIKKFFPTSTMFNCSTNMGTFVAFNSHYECVSHSRPCEWRFDENFTYRHSPKEEKWIAHEYNPNYESLTRGGVIKGYYVN